MVPKPGYKTTEFAVTVLAAVGALVASLTSHLPPRYAALAAMVSTSAYALSRGVTKLGALLAQPTITTQPAPAPVQTPAAVTVPKQV